LSNKISQMFDVVQNASTRWDFREILFGVVRKCFMLCHKCSILYHKNLMAKFSSCGRTLRPKGNPTLEWQVLPFSIFHRRVKVLMSFTAQNMIELEMYSCVWLLLANRAVC
jgi:hypothetical protein